MRQNDNIYKTGSIVAAKKDPNVKLMIRKYIHRTYYCTVIGDAAISQLRYLEKDLLPSQSERVSEANR